jgi:PIN domain nuclease of toxin-antitoxin system
MRLLLDTHALLWWLDGDRKLPRRVRALIEDDANEIIVSAASAWELATKARLGKLPSALTIAQRLPEIIAEQGFTALPISVADAQRAGRLPGPSRDPFERMLAAQALTLGCAMASTDRVFAEYAVSLIW